MTARLGSAGSEILQLAILLALDALFYAVIIPVGVSDPEGIGLDQGLPPSFSARLIAVLAALLMGFRLARLLLGKNAAIVSTIADEDELSVGFPKRGLMGMATALVFSLLAVPFAGFYIASALDFGGKPAQPAARLPLGCHCRRVALVRTTPIHSIAGGLAVHRVTMSWISSSKGLPYRFPGKA